MRFPRVTHKCDTSSLHKLSIRKITDSWVKYTLIHIPIRTILLFSMKDACMHAVVVLWDLSLCLTVTFNMHYEKRNAEILDHTFPFKFWSLIIEAYLVVIWRMRRLFCMRWNSCCLIFVQSWQTAKDFLLVFNIRSLTTGEKVKVKLSSFQNVKLNIYECLRLQ